MAEPDHAALGTLSLNNEQEDTMSSTSTLAVGLYREKP